MRDEEVAQVMSGGQDRLGGRDAAHRGDQSVFLAFLCISARTCWR